MMLVFFFFQAEDGIRDAGEAVIRPGLPEPVGGGFGIIAKALLALAKRNFGQLAVLDISPRPVPFDNVARLIAQRLRLEQKPAIFTVETSAPRFKPASPTGLPYCPPLHPHAPLF